MPRRHRFVVLVDEIAGDPTPIDPHDGRFPVGDVGRGGRGGGYARRLAPPPTEEPPPPPLRSGVLLLLLPSDARRRLLLDDDERCHDQVALDARTHAPPAAAPSGIRSRRCQRPRRRTPRPHEDLVPVPELPVQSNPSVALLGRRDPLPRPRRRPRRFRRRGVLGIAPSRPPVVIRRERIHPEVVLALEDHVDLLEVSHGLPRSQPEGQDAQGGEEDPAEGPAAPVRAGRWRGHAAPGRERRVAGGESPDAHRCAHHHRRRCRFSSDCEEMRRGSNGTTRQGAPTEEAAPYEVGRGFHGPG